jgi:hypothetical protein
LHRHDNWQALSILLLIIIVGKDLANFNSYITMGMAMIGTKISQTLLALDYISKLIKKIQCDIV